ncbi:MAG: hypothetical protein ACM3VW_09805 [Bacteroidota bacterium]
MRRRASVVLVLALLTLFACTGCGGQTDEKGSLRPGPVGVSPGPDKKTTKPPAQPATPPVGEVGEGGSPKPIPWHDAVHYSGVAAGLLALAAVFAGAVLLLGHNLPGRSYQSPFRRRTRWIHIGTGLGAVLCGAIHYTGRRIQAGEWQFETGPPFLTMYFLALVLLSGILRNWTPRTLRKQWWIFAWLHRIGIIGALYYLTGHVLYQYHRFMGKS